MANACIIRYGSFDEGGSAFYSHFVHCIVKMGWGVENREVVDRGIV